MSSPEEKPGLSSEEEQRSTAEEEPSSSEKAPPEKSTAGGEEEEEDDENLETYTVDDAVNFAGYKKFQKCLTFLAGLGWLADAFEVIILSIIGDMIACEWTVRRWQNALMTSIVFTGMTFGAPIFGILADRFGRKTALAISMLLLFIFGASSAASPNYPWMIVLRGLMGFALGGIAQGVTLCCEYYPAKMRGRAGFYLSYYWAIGTLLLVGSAWIIMRHFRNWRIFLLVASFPALIVFLTMKWYPESARYYLVSNQPEKAKKVLLKMATMNNSELPKGKLVEMDASEERGKIIDLLKPEMRRTTLLFWYIWLAIACAYYGLALITPHIITNKSLLKTAEMHANSTIAEDFNQVMPCVEFSDENFRDLLWTSAAELPGLLIFTFSVECCSRRTFLGTSCILLGFLYLFLMLEMKPDIAILFVVFVCRGLVAAVFQLLFIMTTEAFPTTLRASAMGTGSGCARLGGLCIPFLAQITVITKPMPSIFVLSIITVLAGVAALLLPVDTRGKYMQDVIWRDSREFFLEKKEDIPE